MLSPDLFEELMPTRRVSIQSNLPWEVLIARPSDWGNPFSHLSRSRAKWRVTSREEAVECYEKWIEQDRPDLIARLSELRGKVLACYCSQDELCHGDVLIKLVKKYCVNML